MAKKRKTFRQFKEFVKTNEIKFDTNTTIAGFVKSQRKKLKMSQKDLVSKAGVGLRFIRDLEQGKQTLCLQKVNQVLSLFGHVLAPAPMNRDLLASEWPIES